MDSTKHEMKIEGSDLKIALAYRRASERLVLFLHGLGCCKESFEEAWSRDDYNDLSLLAIDLAGFGDSSNPASFSYTMESQAAVCDEVLTRIPFAQLHIVAHSMGGAVGLLLPRHLLEKTVTFANLEGNLIAEDCGLVSRKTISVPLNTFKRDYFPYFTKQFQSERHHHIRLDKTTAHAFYKSSESLVDWSDSNKLLKRFQALPCVKTYFYGKRNSDMKALTAIGDIKAEAITESGHFMMNDNAVEFYSKLLTHMTQGF